MRVDNVPLGENFGSQRDNQPEYLIHILLQEPGSLEPVRDREEEEFQLNRSTDQLYPQQQVLQHRDRVEEYEL